MKTQKTETAQGHLDWDQNELIKEKKLSKKISWDCPFKGRPIDWYQFPFHLAVQSLSIWYEDITFFRPMFFHFYLGTTRCFWLMKSILGSPYWTMQDVKKSRENRIQWNVIIKFSIPLSYRHKILTKTLLRENLQRLLITYQYCSVVLIFFF